ALGVGVRLGGSDRRVDHLDPFAAEDLVEAGAELAVAVVDQDPRPLEQTGEAEVASLLRDPGASRGGCAAEEGDAAAAKLDKEKDVVAAKCDRLDSEEIAGEHARRQLAQELAPAWSAATRRGRQASC